MFYVPFSLFSQSKPCIVRGPNFSRARNTIIDISGTEISFRAPKNQGARRLFMSPVEPLSHYYIPSQNFSYESSLNLVPWDLYRDWKRDTLMVRYWYFNGPNFTGKRANIRFSLTVAKANKPEGTSYFNPRIFEMAIMDKMAVFYGEAGHRDRHWVVPTEWNPIQGFPCSVVRFIADPNVGEHHINEDYEHYVFFPIDDDYIIEIQFSTHRKPVWIDGVKQNKIEPWTPFSPLKDLIDNVASSLEIRLSEHALKQLIKANEGMENSSLADTFAPINIREYLNRRDQAE